MAGNRPPPLVISVDSYEDLFPLLSQLTRPGELERLRAERKEICRVAPEDPLLEFRIPMRIVPFKAHYDMWKAHIVLLPFPLPVFDALVRILRRVDLPDAIEFETVVGTDKVPVLDNLTVKNLHKEFIPRLAPVATRAGLLTAELAPVALALLVWIAKGMFTSHITEGHDLVFYMYSPGEIRGFSWP